MGAQNSLADGDHVFSKYANALIDIGEIYIIIIVYFVVLPEIYANLSNKNGHSFFFFLLKYSNS